MTILFAVASLFDLHDVFCCGWPVMSKVKSGISSHWTVSRHRFRIHIHDATCHCNKITVRKFKPNSTITESTGWIQHQSGISARKKKRISRFFQYASVTHRRATRDQMSRETKILSGFRNLDSETISLDTLQLFSRSSLKRAIESYFHQDFTPTSWRRCH